LYCTSFLEVASDRVGFSFMKYETSEAKGGCVGVVCLVTTVATGASFVEREATLCGQLLELSSRYPVSKN
jgi:hypothetical protein